MRRRGVAPNLVLWHNLMDCQVGACVGVWVGGGGREGEGGRGAVWGVRRGVW